MNESDSARDAVALPSAVSAEALAQTIRAGADRARRHVMSNDEADAFADAALALVRLVEERTKERDEARGSAERWAKLAYAGRDELLDALNAKDAAVRDRDRLQEALERIAGNRGQIWPERGYNVADTMQRIARAAVAGSSTTTEQEDT